MRKRVFIAINLPNEVLSLIDEKLEPVKEKLSISEAIEYRFLPLENWHITITFLGEQEDNNLPSVIQAMDSVVKKYQAPLVEFEKIEYGPPGKLPRMIWLHGTKRTSEILSKIKQELDEELLELGVRFNIERRRFNSHITVARLNVIDKNQLPDVAAESKFNFKAERLDLMESQLKKSGAEYDFLYRAKFLE